MSKTNWSLETNDKNKSARNSNSSIDKRIVEENKQKSKELPIYKGIQPNP